MLEDAVADMQARAAEAGRASSATTPPPPSIRSSWSSSTRSRSSPPTSPTRSSGNGSRPRSPPSPPRAAPSATAWWPLCRTRARKCMTIRNLFPDRIAMRLDEPEQVDMVLGDGARDRGATADLISTDPATGAGVALHPARIRPRPVRVRAAWVSDDDIRAMCRQLRPARPASRRAGGRSGRMQQHDRRDDAGGPMTRARCAAPACTTTDDGDGTDDHPGLRAVRLVGDLASQPRPCRRAGTPEMTGDRTHPRRTARHAAGPRPRSGTWPRPRAGASARSSSAAPTWPPARSTPGPVPAAPPSTAPARPAPNGPKSLRAAAVPRRLAPRGRTRPHARPAGRDPGILAHLRRAEAQVRRDQADANGGDTDRARRAHRRTGRRAHPLRGTRQHHPPNQHRH